MVRYDNADKKLSSDIKYNCRTQSILMNTSHAYAPERNGAAEHLVQKHWTRGRVLMFAAALPENLFAEALHHSNWL